MTRKKTIQELASLTINLTQFATILRNSEDLAFWQSTTIMDAQFGWEPPFAAQADLRWRWTYRLTSALQETLPEAVSASRAIARSRALTDVDKQAGKDLFAQYMSMRALAEEVLRMLKDGNIAAASTLYETRVVQLRNDLSGAAASSTIVIRNRVKQIALDVRLGK